MQVESSKYLAQCRSYLLKVLDGLRGSYTEASVLACDSYSKRYSVSGRGISVAEDDLYTKRGFVLRVKDEKGYAEYSFNHIGQECVDEIVDEAKKLARRVKLPEEIAPMKRSEGEKKQETFKGSTGYAVHPLALGDKAIVERLSAIRASGLSSDEKIMDCIVNVEFQEVHKLFLSYEKDLEQNILWTAGALVMLAGRGEEVKECYRGFSMLGGAEALDGMEAAVGDVAAATVALLDSEMIKPGEYECICTPAVTGMIVHEAFGHGVEMDMFVKDRALAKSYIGKYVASPLVTMHDGAAVARQTGSYFFDDEGTMATDTVIIDKGILRQGICDRLSAEALDFTPTGNGRRESYERKAYTRMTNTWFEGGHDKVEDMIASVKYGFLLEDPSSGMEDPKNWGIQCMVNVAKEIKDGKLTGKIFSPIVLTGYVPDLLCSISMMSETAVLEGGGMCGKGYKEWVKVSDGGPYIKAKIRLG